MAHDTYSLMGLKHTTNEIGGIVDDTINLNLAELQQGASGSIDPTFGGAMEIEPKITFTTLQIAQILGYAGINGSAPATSEFTYQQNTLIGGRAATYLKGKPFLSYWVPRRLRCEQGKEATIQYEVFCIGDASNPPLDMVAEAATYTQDISEKFTLGMQSIETVDYEAMSLEIDFGLEVAIKKHSGRRWPLGAHIKSRKPKITIRTEDIDLSLTLLSGSSGGLTLTDYTGYLMQIAEGGDMRFADVDEEHIQFTATQGIVYFNSVGGQHGSDMAMDIVICPVADGSNPIIGVDTSAAVA